MKPELGEGRRSPVEIWAEIVGLIDEAAIPKAAIDADLDGMAEDPTEAEIEAHESRCSAHYDELIGVRAMIGDWVTDLHEAGAVEEIGQFLAVTYGGRP